MNEKVDSHSKQKANHVRDLLGKVAELYVAAGTQTGFRDFDETNGGLHPGDLDLLGGWPGIGKKPFALNICKHVAVDQKRPVYWASEPNNVQIARANDLVTIVSGTNRFRRGIGKEREADKAKTKSAIAELDASPIYFQTTRSANPIDLMNEAKHIRDAKKGLGLIVIESIDHLMMVAEFDQQNPETVIDKLKNMASVLNVPVLCISGIEPESEKHSHKLEVRDLIGVGLNEKHFDNIMFLHREEYFLTGKEKEKRPECKGQAELNVLKSLRSYVTSFHLDWDETNLQFTDGLTDLHSEFDDYAESEECSGNHLELPSGKNGN